ncbi:sugar transferase [Olleya marilimosa]|jgi:undecaprenyl phosphate N,N'-diacetylbacillosamine 1-phosphate transferase|uniref:Sugar transferase n=1 Tax=Olleya marilimosa TaxID=272164 RepID=A0ABR8LTW8_9FLAO|nr:sugar transferase [Olleya marilimosa]MBD3863141.1 sugar transferase [Olleya marilimosa]MBD3890639.1 sugar transferase [Olleya marilimosa]
MYKNVFKPFFDFIVSLLCLIIFSPIFIIILVILSYFNNGQPFFYQIRPGKHGKLFKVIKFKTMNDKKDDQGNLLSDEKRLTNLGKFVRKTSLDELPQLINVLKGDMSLIGPRPLLPEYLTLYNPIQRKRHDVKPGITGWAQVNGRNAISWEKKFELDVWYVEHLSFKLDAKILFKTILKVVQSEGINGVNAITTEKYTGNN